MTADLNESLRLFRLIIPAFPEVNVFTRMAKKTTALGPVMVATCANKVWGWRAEVIDENNYRGPRNVQGLPDHEVLQRENPAQAVGFYTGLSSTIERVWELAGLYKRMKVPTIAGGWHAHYLPEETLSHNVDIVVHGDGEEAIAQILPVLLNKELLSLVGGISFIQDQKMTTTYFKENKVSDIGLLPYPDFNLVRYARIKVYPISRIRGCSRNCEFCSVKGEPRFSTSRHLFNIVQWLNDTRRAKNFFIVDDRLEEDLKGTLEFFEMISKEYGDSFNFQVQIRLEAAENNRLLEAMKKAGVRFVSIGAESPIDEDLKSMRKGYLSSKMVEWVAMIKRYFWVHLMFIAGYPLKGKKCELSPKEIVKRFKKFIRRARPNSIQVLLPGPGAGTDLRKRLEAQARIFPQDIVPWRYYDGNYVCFIPDGMTTRELQGIPAKIMRWFYWRPFRLLHFLFRTFIIFPIDFFLRGKELSVKSLIREKLCYEAYGLIKKWIERFRKSDFMGKLEEYQQKKLS
ncbi:MAG: cobalamin-dependent protein [Candidatus Pacebacteria bacterium]|nr:cobalamin-dependent protein [Candidatus Paceibacterota bacterium]